jgi:hypothetical protein
LRIESTLATPRSLRWPSTIVGDTIRVWIVEARGTILFIEAETTTRANAQLEREIEQIVGSIRFD